jgi:hypothetical protein
MALSTRREEAYLLSELSRSSQDHGDSLSIDHGLGSVRYLLLHSTHASERDEDSHEGVGL